MSKEFKAKEVDMDLQLTTLSGESLLLTPERKMSTEEALRIMRLWTKKEAEELKDSFDKINLLAFELSTVYDKEPEWWVQNFDIVTLSQIVVFVAEAIGGIEKKEQSSN